MVKSLKKKINDLGKLSLVIAFFVILPLHLRAHQNEAENLVEVSENAIKDENFPLAEESLLKALAQMGDDPNRALVLSNLGIVRQRMGLDSLALTDFNKALAIAPNSVTILLNKMRCEYGLEQYKDMISSCDKIIALDSTLIEPIYMRGAVNLMQGKMEQAEKDCQLLLTYFPFDIETHKICGLYDIATGNFKEALAHYKKLIPREPSVQNYIHRATCYLMIEDFTHASEDIESGMNLDKNNGELYLLRAMLLKKQYRPDEAKKDALTAKKLGIDPKLLKEFL